jgi:hypothetical protein
MFHILSFSYTITVGKTPFANERGVVMRDLLIGKYEHISTAQGFSQALIDLVDQRLSLVCVCVCVCLCVCVSVYSSIYVWKMFC